MIKEKPIIFSGPLIPAIQNLKPDTWPPEPIDPGKPWKWQTRRIIKLPAPHDEIVDFDWGYYEDGMFLPITLFGAEGRYYRDGQEAKLIKPPYQPGDILWVREPWARISDWTEVDPDVGLNDGYIYGADWCLTEHPKWRSPANMPRAAARLWLEVKSARVERLQGISEADAKAEGCDANIIPDGMPSAVAWFHEVWERLNAKRGFGWNTNPWVWVYEFGRIDNYGKN